MERQRLSEVIDAIVAALQPVIRDSGISQDELHEAAAFLNRVGEAGVFPSLLDIAFGMTISDRDLPAPRATRQCLEGPEYKAGAPVRPDGNLIDRPAAPGVKKLEMIGRVLDARSGAPIGGAVIDVWNADEHGDYDRAGYHLRGLVHCDDAGRYRILTILPMDYAEHENDPVGELLDILGRSHYRPAHVHLRIQVGGIDCMTTQIYREDSPYLHQDYVIGAVSDDLLLKFEQHPDAPDTLRAEFDFHVVPVFSGAAA